MPICSSSGARAGLRPLLLRLDTAARFSSSYAKPMDELRLTRSFLETLSTDDLTRLALRFGLDLPNELSRVFVISEILDASSEFDSDDGDELFEDAAPEPVGGLPQSYNETFIGVLLRDPVWAYAFWEIKPSDREPREQDPRFGGYRLRVQPLGSSKGTNGAENFTIPVGVADSAWYLCLPAGTGLYRVDLLCVVGSSEETLASSSFIRVPRGTVSTASFHKDGESSILALSGLDELMVLQGGDRESRLPQRCEA